MTCLSSVFLLPFLNTGAMFALFHIFGTLIPKFSKKISSNPKIASKFFMDPDVRCNEHKTRIHMEIHISILLLVPSDFHWFRVSTCPSFNNTDFVSCLRAAAPYNKLSKKNYEKKHLHRVLLNILSVVERSWSFLGPLLVLAYCMNFCNRITFCAFILSSYSYAITFIDFMECSFMVNTCHGRSLLLKKEPARFCSPSFHFQPYPLYWH